MVQVKAKLQARKQQGAVQFLRVASPAMAERLQPGQPVLIKVGWGHDPFLRRTFYPVSLESEAFVIRVPPDADRGRAWLRMAPEGAELDCLGPIGAGFTMPTQAQRILCIGQSESSWWLLPFVNAASDQGLAVTLAVEATTRRQIIPARDLPLSVEYHVATRDGSVGDKGDLTSALPSLLRWADAVVAAGPMAFYQQLRYAIESTRTILPRGYAQVLVATEFFCGYGACQSCVADIAGGRRRVCLRGPVFDMVDVFRS